MVWVSGVIPLEIGSVFIGTNEALLTAGSASRPMCVGICGGASFVYTAPWLCMGADEKSAGVVID